MSKISIYMFRKYLLGFTIALTVLLGINLLLVFISELKNIGTHEYTFMTLIYYILLLIPQNILDIFPYALLIGSMISFGSMAFHSEFIALNSHGVGIRKTIIIILFQTLIISTLLTVFSNLIAPKYSNEAHALKSISLNKGLSKKDLWFKSSDYVVNVNKIITDKRLEKITIYNLNNGSLSSILSAQKGIYDQQWTLEQVSIQYPVNNEIKSQETYTIQADNFIPFEILKSQFNKKRYISIEDLFTNINFHNKIGIPYDEHKVVFWKKVLLPISCCIMVFIGLPFLFTSIRSTNQSQRLIYGVLFGITYFVVTSIITNLALIISIPALTSVLLSMILFIFVGYLVFNNLIKKEMPV